MRYVVSVRTSLVVAAAVLAIDLVGCAGRGGATATPSNRAATRGAMLEVRGPLGWLAVVPAAADDDGAWAPRDPTAMALVAAPADGLAAGATVTLIPSRGAAVTGRVGAARAIAYGCDGGTLDVAPIDGAARLPPGVAWILPPSPPASWQVAPLTLTAGAATADRRGWRLGPLDLELTRTDATHARLTVRDGGRARGEVVLEKSYMDGADPGPIDLTTSQPGVVEPIAGYAIAPAGPWLLVGLIPGYEGVSVVGYLIGDRRVELVSSLAVYLYQCAF